MKTQGGNSGRIFTRQEDKICDKVETIGRSVISHGKLSDRVYLMKLQEDDFPDIICKIFELAKTNGYSKIFAKVPKWAKEGFERSGFLAEAYIPNFFIGNDDAYFMSFFTDPDRRFEKNAELVAEIIELSKGAVPPRPEFRLKGGYDFSMMSKRDTDDMSKVYRAVFETYPFPIHDPDYILQTMETNVLYFGVRFEAGLVAVSSCEMDMSARNVEMTDFATLPEHSGKGIASFLLAQMELEMKRRGMLTAYTIARAVSYGINITFAKHGYTYTGTLINNTNISGSIESMNVWHKPL